MQVGLHGGGDDGHDRHVVLSGRLQHVRIRAAPHESVAINEIPGGHENVDLVGMLDK
jgi:hypothetical protein